MRWLSPLVVLGLLLAGCSEPEPPAEPQPAPFDGQAAFDFVAGLVTAADGSPRFRVPGTEGHDEAAQWLWDAMQVPGWTVQWQNFTGADYQAAPKDGSTQSHANGVDCSVDEKARLAGLRFHNLWAVQDSGDGERLVLLGAHWESKRFASQDSDAERRDEPVLGANDGASGVGLLLAFMRYVQEHDADLPFRLGVVFFDGEDGFEDCHPLAGSTVFVDRLEEGQVDRFLLLDMVGDPNARFVRESQSNACDPSVVDLLHHHAPSVGLAANFPNLTKSVSDDHVPFLHAGIPAVDLIDFGRTGDRRQSLFGFPPYWHTTNDTMANLDAGMLGRVGDLVLRVLADGRFVADWPTGC